MRSRPLTAFILIAAIAAAWFPQGPAAQAAEEQPAVVVVDAREMWGANDRFWGSAVFFPTEYLDTN